MGNVHAASPGTAPPPPSAGAEPTVTPAETTEEKTEIKNPGTMEDIHKKCKGLR